MVETPKAQEGIWTLIAPDGRKWQAETPIKVVTKEQRDRVPEHIAMERILEAITSAPNLYAIGDKVQDEDGCIGRVGIYYQDGDFCTIENDAAHPNPKPLTS